MAGTNYEQQRWCHTHAAGMVCMKKAPSHQLETAALTVMSTEHSLLAPDVRLHVMGEAQTCTAGCCWDALWAPWTGQARRKASLQ
jgi:hypothetical protein